MSRSSDRLVPEMKISIKSFFELIDDNRQLAPLKHFISQFNALFIHIGFNTPSACCGFIRNKTRQLLAPEFREQSF